MKIKRIPQKDPEYPSLLKDRLGRAAPEAIYAVGNLAILQNSMVGLVSSVQCPGSVVLKTFDLIQKLRDAGVAVISGFHAPMEKDCLDFLLRGPQPVVLCLPKRLQNVRLGPARSALQDGRLLLLSRFGDDARWASAQTATDRNDLVAALSQYVMVPHASPKSKTWIVVKRAIDRGQKIISFDDPANAQLFAAGAVEYTNEDIVLENFRV